MGQQKTSRSAWASIVFAFLFFPFGLALGLYSLVKIKRAKGALLGRRLAIAGVVLSTLALVLTLSIYAKVMSDLNAFRCVAHQRQVNITLLRLQLMQESHKRETGEYTTSLVALGLVNDDDAPYRIEVEDASATSFAIKAQGQRGPIEGDVWVLENTLGARNTKNACK